MGEPGIGRPDDEEDPTGRGPLLACQHRPGFLTFAKRPAKADLPNPGSYASGDLQNPGLYASPGDVSNPGFVAVAVARGRALGRPTHPQMDLTSG